MGDVGDEKNKSDDSISMILLVTLPIDSIVSPLIPKLDNNNNSNNGDDAENTEDNNNNNNIEGQGQTHDDEEERKLFESFSFEDYAWRVYHERLLFKDDPLDRYRI